MKKNIGRILICLIFVVFSCNKKSEKDLWLEEPAQTKYSKEREIEVWGKVLRGDDAELFYGTSLYPVALAIAQKDSGNIDKLINNIESEDINYQEPKFNSTLGHLALSNNNLDAISSLVNKGLDCNIMNREGSSVITSINDPFKSRLNNSLKVLKHIVKNGGNVNLLNNRKNADDRTPLIVASMSNIENVKFLIESGANPHFVYKESPNDQFPQSPLISALQSERLDIIEFLVMEVGVDFKSLKYSPSSKYFPNGHKILGYFRGMTFELDSKNHKHKMRLVNYLKEQGLDYWNAPIPKRILKNKNFDEDYLKKY